MSLAVHMCDWGLIHVRLLLPGIDEVDFQALEVADVAFLVA
jgi:hypothetical protein